MKSRRPRAWSPATTYCVVAGNEPGFSKVEKAQQLGVPVITL